MDTPAIRTALAVLTALPLTLLTACGDSGSDSGSGSGSGSASGPGRADGSGTRATTSAPSGPLSARELEKRSLGKREVKGFFISEPGTSMVVTEDQVGTDRKQCRPLGLALSSVAMGNPAATAQRWAVAEVNAHSSPDAPASVVMITLASYDDAEGARAALTRLKKAVTTCPDGFTGTQQETESRFTKITEDTSPRVGDDPLGFTATLEEDGGTAPMKAFVFREGSTLAYFSAVDFGTLDGSDFTFPVALAKAQEKKLR